MMADGGSDDCLHDVGISCHVMPIIYCLHMLMSDDRHDVGLLLHTTSIIIPTDVGVTPPSYPCHVMGFIDSLHI